MRGFISHWHKKVPDDAGALVARETRKKSVFRDERRSRHVEQVVGADFEDLLVRMNGSGTVGEAGGGTTKTMRAASEGKFLRTVLQIIVFEFDGPVVGDRMFNANTEEKTIQSATGC